LGYCDRDTLDYTPLAIGSDVWIGHGALILPNVTEVGHGAVVAAGSVVNKNVPSYAVVAGNPARVVRFRFAQEIIESLLASKWWEKDIAEIRSDIDEYRQPFEELFYRRLGREKSVLEAPAGQSDSRTVEPR